MSERDDEREVLRVTAIEEIDESKTRWLGHVAVELTLTDAKSGDVLWSHAYEQREPLAVQTPEGLARALGVAMDRIAHDAAPAISELADRQAQRMTTASVFERP